MKTATFVVVFALATVVGCKGGAPQLSAEVVKAELLKDKGLLAGFDFGMSWEDIKNNRDKDVTKVIEDKFRQLRYEKGPLGEDGFFLSFGFRDGRCSSMSADVTGTGKNGLVVENLFEEFNKVYTAKYGAPECTTSTDERSFTHRCKWSESSSRPHLELRLMKIRLEDDVSVHLDVGFTAPR